MFTVLNTDDLLPASIKKTVLELDRSRILSDAEGHASQSYVLEVAKAGAWPKFWDNALDCGPASFVLPKTALSKSPKALHLVTTSYSAIRT